MSRSCSLAYTTRARARVRAANLQFVGGSSRFDEELPYSRRSSGKNLAHEDTQLSHTRRTNIKEHAILFAKEQK